MGTTQARCDLHGKKLGWTWVKKPELQGCGDDPEDDGEGADAQRIIGCPNQ